ncbi:inactive dipeptidyl peptidase 10 isoform X1 [Vanessa cardui]|uniref:inactive dipeptidyl peptidase 10 isoform X1 n=1 Tax=Vanessa cardui TaxID=171605 RepID=UPI001F12F882|nr:inactive dipeptidyl peptidase 10 isoform X1 [Vanessa cardui]XP_046973506.1 inactive dipeptidyl peptidase 10 isoform X1 [Vanessa cardui]
MADNVAFDDEKLVVGSPNQRNWRGILIALLVIVAVLALIVTSVVLLTPPDEGPRVKGRRLKIQDLLTDELVPIRWNGTWISGDEFVYQDSWGGIALMFAANQTSKTLMPNTTFRVLEPASFSLSADRRFLLLAHAPRKIHQYSFLARYTVYDILTTESYPLTPLPDDIGGGVISEGPLLLLAMWTPKGHGLITVKDYDIFYRPAPRSSTGYRVTDTGIPGRIFNGVPDWLYEVEILHSRSALWMSADGHMVLYATFNDSLVHEQKYPWYGAALDTDDPAKTYPEIRSVRYPKPGTNNPIVKLTVADIADPKHIRTRHLTPPKIILEEGDYYFTSAQWVSLTEVCVVWLTRVQNLSVVSVCKSPMWYCQEVYRVFSGTEAWVESAPAPLWSSGGGALVTLAPVRDGPAGLFRHVVRAEHNAHGPRALPLTHGSFDVVKLLAWDHANQHIYYLGIPEGKPGQQHLYRVSSEAPRPGTPQKLPYCVTCNSQPSPAINLEFYGNLASSGDSTWDNDWDEELPATSPAPSKKKKKKQPENIPQNLPCLYHDAHFSPSSTYFVLECLGPGVPTSSLHKISLPEPRLLMHLENNTLVKEKLSVIALPTPRTFSVQLSSGQAARVRLLLPPGLREDEVTKYPLVMKVNGAPGTQLVTEQWSLDWGSLAAGAGAILASVDARGAGGRGLAAHHTLHRRLGTVELKDQLEVAEYLRDSLHFIDARRVAVWGRAHGGFLAALALASPLRVFHCGVAITPIIRWRYYASAYSERYMGFPNATGNYRGYADADVTKQAAALQDKMLLLVHGTADDNVHVQQTMALARALSDQGSTFRQQIYPDEGHSLEGVKKHLFRTMSSFLDDCFKKQVPPETKAGLRNGGNLD